MAKKINIIANLIDTHFRKQVKDLENGKYKIDVNVDNGKISNANKHMQQLNNTVVNSNTVFGKLKSTINNTFSTSRMTMTGFLAVLNEINKAGKKAKETIKEVDKAVTDLSIATNMSREATAGLVKEYNNYAKELKSTTTQITSAADDYLRAGKSMSETKKLIEDSVMLSKLGQLETPEATEDLLATMNGFEMSVEEVGRALDAMVAIDMKAATSAGDIATALKYSASSADMAGLSFNKLASMIGTVQDKTQQSAETVGTFMNTLLSRYRNVKIGQFVSDDGEDLSEVETILESLDIKLRDSNLEFRNFELVIDEVASKWQSYSSVQQAAIAKAFSGTRQQNRFIALMEGYNKVLELTEVAANSAGTALEKFNNSYKGSLEAKRNDLQASFESMIMNSDMDEVYSGILDATTALVNFINKTNALKGVMTGLSVSAGVKGFLTLRTAINESYIAMNQFSNALKIVKQTKISTADFDKLLLLTKNLSDSQMKMVISSNALGLKQKELLLINSGLSAEEAKLKLQTYGLTTAQTGLTVATTSLGNALKGVLAYMAANPILVFTMAISGLTMAYQSYNQKLEEIRQKNIEASESAIDHANSLKDLYNEYSRLSAIQGRSSAEEEEFKTVIEDVIKALGDKAKVLEGLTAGTNEYTEALAKATKEELQSASADATIGRKSAEEELQADIWSEWSGSKVSIDSNSKGKSISDKAQRAVDIVSDALKDFETVNRTWDNLSWDISSDSPEEALEYYNALLKAREELVLASENDEVLLDTEIYKDMNNAINIMEESLDSYITKRYEEEKLNYMALHGIPQTVDEYKVMQDALAKTTNESQALQDKFNTLLMSDFSGLANELESVADVQAEVGVTTPDMTKFTSSISTSVQQIATQLEPQFAKLGEAYQNIFTADGFTLENVDNSMLEELRQSFAEIEEEIGVAFDARQLNSFFDTLTNGNSTAEQVQQSFNELATAYFYSTDTLEQLNDETADAIEKQLEELGVVNAHEIVLEQLAMKEREATAEKIALAESSKDLTNITGAEIVELRNEGVATSEIAQDMALFALQKQAANLTTLSTSNDISNLSALAFALAATGQECIRLNQLINLLNGNTVMPEERKQNIINSIQTEIENIMSGKGIEIDIPVDFSGSTDSASSAGGEAGDAYVDAYEEAVSELDDLKDQGKITEKNHLDYLRKLYEKYFKNIGKYAKKFAQEQSKYLQGMKSLYQSALSGITGLISKQIDSYNDQKDAAVDALEEQKEAAIDALEAERDARVEVLETQKEQLEEQIELIDSQIKAKEKVIDSINDEIDAMKDANEERKRQIDLQKAQYELEKMQNQRTILQYSEEKGMHYVTDESGIRDARQNVEDKKLEIEVANKEKQIDLIEKEIELLEDQKDAINDQIDSIEEQIDSINEYYDNLIEQTEKSFDEMIKNTEKYWDNLIKGLENYKSRWEELAELEENAKLISLLEQLGISTQDILGMSGEAFEKFKGEYIGILADIYSGNDSMTSALAQSLGTTTDKLGSYIESTQGYINSLSGSADTLQPVADALTDTADGMDELNTSASNASASTSTIADNMGTLNTNTTGLSDNLSGINGELNTIPDVASSIDNIAKSYDSLVQSLNDEDGTGIDAKLDNINAELSEIPEDASTKIGSIATEYDKLDASIQNEDGTGLSDELININDALTNLPDASKFDAITASFTKLGDAITGVATALGVGSEGTVGGLVQALQTISTLSLDGANAGGKGTNTQGGAQDGSTGGGGGIISQFNQLKDAVDAVTSAIGGGSSGGSSGGESSEGEGGSSGGLIGAINAFKDATDTALGGGESGSDSEGKSESEGEGSGAIPQFEQLKTAVDDVTTSIGSEDAEDEENLIGAITNLGEKATEIVGSPDEEETITGRFKQMDNVLGDANAHVTGISDGLDAIDGKEVECTIKVNIETNGSTSFAGAGMVLGSMNLNSAEYKAQYGNAHYEGTAKVTGDWGTREGGKTLMGELGREIVVRGSRFFTVGDNGAEFVDLQRGDIVFNHLQTRELLSKGNLVGRGKALAGGTINTPANLPPYLRPLQEGDKMYDLLQKMNNYQESFGGQIIQPVNAIQKNMDAMVRNISNVNNRTINNSPVVHMTVNCPGVTTNELANQVSAELNKAVNGMSLYAYQKASITR